MRKLWMLVLLGALISGDALAWVEIEDDDNNTWRCDAEYCYREGTRRHRNDFLEWMLEDDNNEPATTWSKDPLAMPPAKGNNNRDKNPLAMPTGNGKNSNDPLAF